MHEKHLRELFSRAKEAGAFVVEAEAALSAAKTAFEENERVTIVSGGKLDVGPEKRLHAAELALSKAKRHAQILADEATSKFASFKTDKVNAARQTFETAREALGVEIGVALRELGRGFRKLSVAGVVGVPDFSRGSAAFQMLGDLLRNPPVGLAAQLKCFADGYGPGALEKSQNLTAGERAMAELVAAEGLSLENFSQKGNG